MKALPKPMARRQRRDRITFVAMALIVASIAQGSFFHLLEGLTR